MVIYLSESVGQHDLPIAQQINPANWLFVPILWDAKFFAYLSTLIGMRPMDQIRRAGFF